MSSQRILKNSVYSLLGWAAPVIVNILTVPYIVRMLGNDKYGVLILASAIIGYFSILDINLTAGSIRYISEYHAKGDFGKVNQVLSLSLFGYSVIGIIGSILIYYSTDLFLLDWLSIPAGFKNESKTVFHVTAIGFFLNILQSYLSSIPKAIHRFDISAKIESGFGIGLILLTVALLHFGIGLLGIVTLRIIVALVNCITFFVVTKHLIPTACFNTRVSRSIINNIASFSGYSFMSKMAATLGGNTDRLIIGSFINSAAVTLYTVPAQLVNRLMNISLRLAMVIFPVASELGASGKHEQLEAIYIEMTRYLFFLNAALTTFLCLFSHQILQLWMGDVFAHDAYILLIFICLGMFLDSMTNLPSIVNDGLSFPQITGAFSIIRSIFGCLALILGARLYGLLGITLAYAFSSLLFGISFLIYVHKKTLKISFIKVIREAYLGTTLISLLVATILLLIRTITTTSIGASIIEILFVVTVFTAFGYTYIITDIWRIKITNYIGLT